MQNLGRRLVLMLMRADILVGEVTVVAMGVIHFSEKRCLSATEVEFLGVGFGLVRSDILVLSGFFVAVVLEMEVDDLEVGGFLFEWEDVLLVAFESNVFGREKV